ncbi:uncharacterized protein LOC114312145 [Camellia sinensis]|uniref:uncharacterized protein LOC114312145 n=1 Tax=Camellia sinensis TaxID=4442 RepID=UPI0010367DBE|nr:uncharacterized protein LOC114312145 [Camellia sinensis]
MKLPTFFGVIEPLKAETWLLEIEKLFEVFTCSKTQKVLLAAYILKDEACRWWLLIRNNNGNITWSQFNKIFYNKYFPQCFRDCKVFEFQELKQGNMSVAEYEAKFTELARFAPHMMDTDYKKAQKFEGGLMLEVFDQVRILKLPTYVEVLDRALMAETTLATMKQSKAPTTTERRSKRSGNKFRKGNSFGNKKQNTRSSNNSSQSSGSIPNCPNCDRKHRGVCYRASRACYQCGKVGHMMKIQNHESPNCKASFRAFERGCEQAELQSKNANRPVTSSTGSASVTRSNVRTNARGNTGNEMLRQGRVSTLVPGDVQNTEFVVSAYDIVISDVRLYVDLLPLGIDHFDCIVGMDWLTKYCVTIDCVNKSVVFRSPGLPEFVFIGNGAVPSPYLISAMKTVKLLRKGCKGYMCCVLTKTFTSLNVETIPIACEFPDVFPTELLGGLIDREIEFTIDVIPGTQPISKTPYRKSTSELKELKIQLQDLLDKKFIRLSTSPWSAPVLFVKKKDGS